MKKCLVLFSGGVDSTTALFWALRRYDKVYAVTFDYGQRHRLETRMARRLAKKLNIPLKTLRIDLSQVGGSSLTDTRIPLPAYRKASEIGKDTPSTYVPFRNGIFLSLAAAWAEVLGMREIVCGFNIIDSPNYPDTRKTFVKAMEDAINFGTKASLTRKKFKIVAPFIDKSKSGIIKKGLALGADYSYSISCYSGREIPCRKCSSCHLRQKAWREAGKKDHLILRLEREGKI